MPANPDAHVLLITGAASNLCLEIVRALLLPPHTQRYNIILGSRSLERGRAAVEELKEDLEKARKEVGSEVEAVRVDIEDEKSVEECVKEVTEKYGRVDTLINNAGSNLDFEVMRGNLTTRQAFERSFFTNVVATHLFTSSLIPLLLHSRHPQIVFLSSGISSLTEHGGQHYPVNKSPEEKGWPKTWTFNSTTYRTSKTAANMMALEWRRTLKSDGVKIHLVDPGFLATTLGGNEPEKLREMGATDPSEGAELVRKVVEGERDGDEGRVVMKDGGVVHLVSSFHVRWRNATAVSRLSPSDHGDQTDDLVDAGEP